MEVCESQYGSMCNASYRRSLHPTRPMYTYETRVWMSECIGLKSSACKGRRLSFSGGRLQRLFTSLCFAKFSISQAIASASIIVGPKSVNLLMAAEMATAEPRCYIDVSTLDPLL